jgi:hypothetical protein
MCKHNRECLKKEEMYNGQSAAKHHREVMKVQRLEQVKFNELLTITRKFHERQDLFCHKYLK